MITVTVKTDWLNTISDMTVTQAIKYLQTLDPTYKLNYSQISGDDQGVEISSDLSYQREETEAELEADRAARKQRKVERHKQNIAYYSGKLLTDASPRIKEQWQRYLDSEEAELKELT